MTTADDFILQLAVEKGLIDNNTLSIARNEAQSAGSVLNIDSATLDLLIEKKYLSHEQVANLLGEEFHIPVIRLNDITASREALSKFTRKECLDKNILPLSINQNIIEIAICDPFEQDIIDNIGNTLKMQVDIKLAPFIDIKKNIEKYYGSSDTNTLEGFAQELQEQQNEAEISGIATGNEADVSEEDAPIIRFVHMLITEAVKRRASDIHLEPLEKRFRVRYRIDGVLVEVENPPKRLQPSIISRLKLMANISIAEKRIPQDGRIQIHYGQKDIDLRVSVLPTVFGESIVMRILDKEGLRLGLPELGFFSDDQATFERVVSMADGIFLVTGPTGSGKSTTLYSGLNVLNKPDKKIITVEDPVEYQMSGINQVQVRKNIGMTFAAALRSMLRQAPNIIMIGEIRDLETADIAVNASLTGHMVFSTLHTNDAPSAVTRLADIGVKPFLISASLRAVLAQRLVRKICSKCKAPVTPDLSVLNAIGIQQQEAENTIFYGGVGCPTCNGSGFKGRLGIFEMFIVNEEIEQMIYENRTIIELRQKARELGMRTMREDGVRKILSGLTSVDEVLKTTLNDSNQ